jgi:hypothetical protein
MSTMTLDSLFDHRLASMRRPELRLTRRGRVVVLMTGLLLAFVVGVFVSAAGSVATEHPGTPAPTRILQVTDGDTLWDISSQLAHRPGGDGDTRAMEAQIQQLNALDTSDLYAGERLVVPAG